MNRLARNPFRLLEVVVGVVLISLGAGCAQVPTYQVVGTGTPDGAGLIEWPVPTANNTTAPVPAEPDLGGHGQVRRAAHRLDDALDLRLVEEGDDGGDVHAHRQGIVHAVCGRRLLG